MSIDSVYGASLQGIQRGVEGVERSASKVAQATTAESETQQQTNITEALVEAKVYSNQVSASAKTLEITDKAIGSLLDEKA